VKAVVVDASVAVKWVIQMKKGAMPPCTIIWVGDLGSPAT